MILTADVNSSNITTSSENIQGMLSQDHHASTPAPAVMVQRNSNALRAIVSVLSDLHARWARRPFSSPALWEIKATEVNEAFIFNNNQLCIIYLYPYMKEVLYIGLIQHVSLIILIMLLSFHRSLFA